MRIFTIIGTLITVLIIGFMAAMYMNASTAPMTGVGGEANPMNAVDAARNLVSVDSARQNDMRDQMDKVWGGQ